MNARRLGLLLCGLPLLVLAGCGEGGGGDGNSTQLGSGQGSDGALVSLAQAQQGAAQWWKDHDDALLHRDAKKLTTLDAEPVALVEVELVRSALATNQGIIAAVRQPQATRVHVPATQKWPVQILAVYDVPGANNAVQHEAVLLAKLNPGGAFIATETAGLADPEPQLDTDAAGYVRMGDSATRLAQSYADYMENAVHATALPSSAPFAPGRFTSEFAANDSALLHDAPGRSHGTLNTVDISYALIATPAPIFQLAGNQGGFTIFAARRIEVLHPRQGQALFQDPQRKNYGIDLAPGQYQQVTIATALFLATRVPPGGAAAQVIGSGGGTYQES